MTRLRPLYFVQRRRRGKGGYMLNAKIAAFSGFSLVGTNERLSAFGRALLTTTAASLTIAAPAFAQTVSISPAASTADVEDGPEILVTAQRRLESLQDVPISITAIGAAAIARQNIKGLDGFVALAPNVDLQSNGSRDRKDVFIRGIGNQLAAYSFADVRAATTPFYIDEFNVSAGTSNPQILDLDRIEVLRGPQGTYFGRNAIGGAVNITTKHPVDRWEGSVALGYSSFNTREIEGVLNVPVIEGLLAIRASGQIEKSDGNIKNINSIGGGNDSDYKTGRVTARVTPMDGLVWDTTYSYSKENVGMRSGVPTGVLTQTWRNIYYGGRPGNVASPDGVGFFPTNDDEVNFNRPQDVGTKFRYVSSRAVYDFGGVSLTGVVGHLASSVFNYGDVDGGSLDLYYERNKIARRSTSGELRLQSSQPGMIEWSLGGNVGKDRGGTDLSTINGTQAPFGGRANVETFGNNSKSTTKYAAAFGQVTLNLGHFSLIAGLRYSSERVATYSVTRSGGISSINDRGAKFHDLSPRLTATYKIDDDTLVYATASRGFKAGGVQTGNSLLLRNDYKPERLWNFEGGLKTELFDKRLRLDLQGFYMRWTNVQESVRFIFLDSNNNFQSINGIQNAARAHSAGAEFSADFKVSREFVVSGQIGFLSAKFDKYTNALVDGLIIDASGKPLVSAPRWTLGSQAQYTRKITADWEAFLRGEWYYRDKELASPFGLRYNNFPFIAPSYNKVNLRIGLSNDTWNLTAYAENLLKKKFYSNPYEKAFYSGVYVEPSYRRFGVKLGYSFK